MGPLGSPAVARSEVQMAKSAMAVDAKPVAAAKVRVAVRIVGMDSGLIGRGICGLFSMVKRGGYRTHFIPSHRTRVSAMARTILRATEE